MDSPSNPLQTTTTTSTLPTLKIDPLIVETTNRKHTTPQHILLKFMMANDSCGGSSQQHHGNICRHSSRPLPLFKNARLTERTPIDARMGTAGGEKITWNIRHCCSWMILNHYRTYFVADNYCSCCYNLQSVSQLLRMPVCRTTTLLAERSETIATLHGRVKGQLKSNREWEMKENSTYYGSSRYVTI